MPWTAKPTTTGADVQAYDWLIEFWKAIRERHRALKEATWPRGNTVWGNGTIASLAKAGDGTYTLADPSANWVNTNPKCGSPRFYGYTCEKGFNYLPRYYDAIIAVDELDERLQVRAPIVGQDSRTTVRLSAVLEDYVAAGLIASVGSLVGKPVSFIKRGGLWWADREDDRGRWLAWPNDQELDRGTVQSSTTTTLTIPDTVPLGQRKRAWSDDEFAGCDLLVYAGGRLQRRRITSNTDHTLTFPGMPAEPSGDYLIVKAGGRGFPGRTGGLPRQWYSGAGRYVWGHQPDDSIYGVVVAQSQLRWESGHSVNGVLDCDPLYVSSVLDHDVWSDLTEECSEADDPKAPNLFKSLRGLQAEVIGLCGQFVEDKDYGIVDAIPQLTPARLFHVCGINSGTSAITGTGVDNAGSEGTADDVLRNASFGVDSRYDGHGVFYTVVSKTGDNLESGNATVVAGRVMLGDRNNDVYAGRSVIWSAGFTRFHPLLVQHLYERTAFIPDYEVKGDPIPALVVYDPPTVADYCCDDQDKPPATCCEDCFGTGMYVTHTPDASYLTFDDHGLPAGGPAFKAGDCARYVGENASDSVANQADPVEYSDGRPDGYSPDLPYFDRMYEGSHLQPPWGDRQIRQRADRIGRATSGTSRSLTDTTKRWWSDWFVWSTLRTHEGTLVGGSATTAVIGPEFLPTSHDERGCYFKPERFNGKAVFADFVIEVDHGEVTYKLPITSVDGQTVRFADTGVAFKAGDAWRIREAPKLNRYRGMRVSITDPDTNETHTVAVTHSDDDTLFFAPQTFSVAEGWTYQVLERETGAVLRWTGMEWAEPTGTDPRGNVPWHANPNENEPHWRRAYGLLHKHDWVGPHLFDELYRTINALAVTAHGCEWSGRKDPKVEERNYQQAAEGPQGDIEHPPETTTGWTSYGALQGYLEECLNLAFSQHYYDWNEDNGPPFSRSQIQGGGTIAEYGDTAGTTYYGVQIYEETSYGYAVLNNLSTYVPINNVTFVAYAQLDSVDSDETDRTILQPVTRNDGSKYLRPNRIKSSFFSYAGTQFRKWTTFGSASGYRPEYREVFGGPLVFPVHEWPEIDGESDGATIGSCYVSQAKALVRWAFEYHG